MQIQRWHRILIQNISFFLCIIKLSKFKNFKKYVLFKSTHKEKYTFGLSKNGLKMATEIIENDREKPKLSLTISPTTFAMIMM